jgi:hypothetical protein
MTRTETGFALAAALLAAALAACESGAQTFGAADANSYGYLGGVGVRSINPDPIIE